MTKPDAKASSESGTGRREGGVTRDTCRGACMLPHVVAAFEEEIREEDNTRHGEAVEQLHVGDGGELECCDDQEVALDIGDSECGHEQQRAQPHAFGLGAAAVMEGWRVRGRRGRFEVKGEVEEEEQEVERRVLQDWERESAVGQQLRRGARSHKG